MKKIFLIIGCSLLVFHSFAQREYWGMTTQGGKYYDTVTFTYGAGVIYKTDKKGKKYQVVYNFDSIAGIEPYGSLIQATNGKLYGITGSVSSTMFTCLFEFDPMTRVYKVLMRADTFRNGRSYRFGSPFQASNGKLYSLVSNFLIETDLNTSINTVIASGLNPAGGENQFMESGNGKVFFVTIKSNGLVGQRGAIYEFDLLTKAVVLRHQFWDQTGSRSYGIPVEWTPGVLYGTFAGGADSTTNSGGVFRYDLNTGIYEIKQLFYNIGIKRSSIAYGGLTRFGNKLYGATLYGGQLDYGFLYRYDPATNVLDTLANFATLSNGLIYDSLRGSFYDHQNGWGTELLSSYDNRLYGLTGGSMFSYNPVDSQFRSLNSLSSGPTQFSGSLGFSVNYGHLLEICLPPYHFTAIPDTLHVFQNDPFSFTISTPNTDTFHWVKNVTTTLPLQTDSILHFDTTRLTDQGWYTCTLINECGDSTTKRFFLKVDIVTPLPLVFSGRVQGTNALLQWTDPADKDVDTYTLQQSADGRSFTGINTTKAKPSQQSYYYTDKGFEAFANASSAKAFYRLVQKNKDGKEAYSNIILLTTDHSFCTISPNPAKDKVIITFSRRIRGNVRLDLFATNGQLLQTNETRNVTTETINIGYLPTGIYNIKITTPKTTYTKKLVIEK